MDQIGGAGCKEAAQRRITYDDDGADDHGPEVIDAKEAAEEFSAGSKTGCCIGNKKQDDDDGCNGVEYVFIVVITLREKIRNRNGIDMMGISTNSFGNDEPVDIGPQSQSDGGPGSVSDSRKVSDAGQSHQKPAAHIRGFGAHGGDKGTQLSAAEIKITDIVVLL